MNSLGLKTVATSGTPVQLTTDTGIFCNVISVQPIKAGGAQGVAPTPNSGYVYLMRGNTAKGTALTGCVLMLDQEQPSFSIKAPTQLGFRLSDFYLDADVSGDGALIAYA
jgi:hypothetical protein